MRKFALASFVLCLGWTSALAAPPPMDSADWAIMQPYAEWITKQHDGKGDWCCDVADGRPVESRINAAGQWEAYITHDHWPMVTADHWEVVPDGKVLRQPNPIGIAVLWYGQYTQTIFCFAPASGM